MEKTEQMKGINIGKFLCATLVLISHMGPFDSFNPQITYYTVNLSFRFAVPFFFLCTGYFLYNRLDSEKNSKRLLLSVKRLFSLYFIWTCIYVVFSLPYTITIETIRDFIFRGSVFHFWYFPSLIISLVFTNFLIEKFAPPRGCGAGSQGGLIVVCLLYIIGLLGDSYGNLLPYLSPVRFIIDIYHIPFAATRNGFLFPSIFIYLGAILARNKNSRIWKIDQYKWFVFSYLLFVIEFLFITKMKLARDLNLYIFIVPTVIMLFLVLKDVNVTLRLNCLMLRKMSVVIYCSHVLIMRLMDAYVFSTVKVNSLVRCVGVLLVTYMISFLIVALSSKIKLLKLLY